MPLRRIGVRELRSRACEVIRAVRGDGAEYVITYRGRPVAVLRGLRDDAGQDQVADSPAMASEGVYDDYLGMCNQTEPDIEQRLDSLTWGQWHTMTEAQRLALLDALECQARPDQGAEPAAPSGHPPV